MQFPEYVFSTRAIRAPAQLVDRRTSKWWGFKSSCISASKTNEHMQARYSLTNEFEQNPRHFCWLPNFGVRQWRLDTQGAMHQGFWSDRRTWHHSMSWVQLQETIARCSEKVPHVFPHIVMIEGRVRRCLSSDWLIWRSCTTAFRAILGGFLY